eukprot:12465092-Ditylum_brightwellii.AAC.1
MTAVVIKHFVEFDIPASTMLLVVLVVVEKVEKWCRCWCVCCCHLSLLLRPPDFGIYRQVAGL